MRASRPRAAALDLRLGGRPRYWAAFVLLALALVAAAQPAPARAEIIPFRGEQVVKFEGQGWGHGVGMSQWGARGRALAGQSYEEIIGTYYTGVAIGEAPTDQTPMRVLIHQNYRPPAIDGSAPSSNKLPGDIIGLQGPWAIAGATGPLPAGARLRLLQHPGQHKITVRLIDAAGQHMLDFDFPGFLEVIPLAPETRLQVYYKLTTTVSDEVLDRFFDVYRGTIRVYQNDEGLIDTVNVLSLEDYTRAVVPSEMPSHWPAEALKAQALAARTYGLTSLQPANQVWDVDDTTNFQAYLGANRETPTTDAATVATARRVITHQSEPIRAFFFSSANGYTESNEDVFGGPPLPYLRSVRDADPSGRAWDADSARSVWSTNEFPLATLSGVVAGASGLRADSIRALDFSRRAPSGRMIEIAVHGDAGPARIGAWDFVTRFNRETSRAIGPLLSTRFNIVFAYPLTRAVTPLNLAGGQSIYFDETGHNVRHGFLKYFQAHGGVEAFGLPLTEEFFEQGRAVQYFERARFEYHPEQVGTPYEVQLGLLGDLLTAGRRPFVGSAPFPNVPDHRFFPETGHGVNFAFLNAWETQGGLERFGFPISEEILENGVTAQYFQRARLEYRPDQPPGQRVTVAKLGSEHLRSRGLMP